jgi:hypothetical protein
MLHITVSDKAFSGSNYEWRAKVDGQCITDFFE